MMSPVLLSIAAVVFAAVCAVLIRRLNAARAEAAGSRVRQSAEPVQEQRHEFDLRESVRSVIRAHRRLAWSSGIELRVEFATETPGLVSGDSKRLEQMLRSLLAIAVRFTGRGMVEIRVAPQARQRIRFEVEDPGIGLARTFGLMKQTGGAIEVSSQPGGESRLWFELPLEAVSPAAFSGVDMRTGAGPLHVLVVEDDAVNQRVARALLGRLGHQVDTAANGQEAIEKWTSGLYDMVLMDCQMPVMDGYEATAEIRRKEGVARRTPIVALTALALHSDRDKCLACGMDDYLTKPVHLHDLKAALDRHGRRAIA